MATTVQEAFEQFNKNHVNLDSTRTKIARKSREWLLGQLSSLPGKVVDFPRLFAGKSLNYGSFSRNTKIRPLDDIDMILTFSAQGTSYWEISYGTSYTLTVPEDATALKKLCNDDGTLNSIKLVNKLVSSLSGLEHYKSAAIHRKQEAATLSLSYEWTYDIVPAFYTDTGYYLIPDGIGGWKATDPRLDETRLNNLIQKHGGHILQLIRTLKFWNLRASMTTIPSYLFENIILSYLESVETIFRIH